MAFPHINKWLVGWLVGWRFDLVLYQKVRHYLYQKAAFSKNCLRFVRREVHVPHARRGHFAKERAVEPGSGGRQVLSSQRGTTKFS